ncbi:MAG TPA: TrmH family RNA methyltransferase, partial [Prolixibacteraceae bacterium]|nr:TrmH family RNA methyltransferase [Prolixibacteraceae bacterium]
YNPKVVQASMGALAHVSVFYTDLIPFLSEKKEQGIPIYGTFLEGENIYGSSLTSKGMIVFGNEGKGISQETEKLIDRKLMIPSHATGRLSVESLNVSVAAAIVCSEFRRNALK